MSTPPTRTATIVSPTDAAQPDTPRPTATSSRRALSPAAAQLLHALPLPAALVSSDGALLATNRAFADLVISVGGPRHEQLRASRHERAAHDFPQTHDLVGLVEPSDLAQLCIALNALTSLPADPTVLPRQLRVGLIDEHGRHGVSVIVHAATAPPEVAEQAVICQFEPVSEHAAVNSLIAQLAGGGTAAEITASVLDMLAAPPTELHAAVATRNGNVIIEAAHNAQVACLAGTLLSTTPWAPASSEPTVHGPAALPPSAADALTDAGYHSWFHVSIAADPADSAGRRHLMVFCPLPPEAVERRVDSVALASTALRLAYGRFAQTDQLVRAASRDPLTNVANRRGLELACTRTDYHVCGVLYVDLDHLKPTNDQLGHHVGDEVLRTTARRLERRAGPHDFVARIGGDEFVIVLRCPDESPVLDTNSAARLAQGVVDDLSAPIHADGRLVRTAASVGVAVSTNCTPGRSRSLDELLTLADSEMYRAKRNGGNTYRISTI